MRKRLIRTSSNSSTDSATRCLSSLDGLRRSRVRASSYGNGRPQPMNASNQSCSHSESPEECTPNTPITENLLLWPEIVVPLLPPLKLLDPRPSTLPPQRIRWRCIHYVFSR